MVGVSLDWYSLQKGLDLPVSQSSSQPGPRDTTTRINQGSLNSPAQTAVELCSGSYGQTACPDFSRSMWYESRWTLYSLQKGLKLLVPQTSSRPVPRDTSTRMQFWQLSWKEKRDQILVKSREIRSSLQKGVEFCVVIFC